MSQWLTNALTINGDTTVDGERDGTKKIFIFTENAITTSVDMFAGEVRGKRGTMKAPGASGIAMATGSITGVSCNYDVTATGTSAVIRVFNNTVNRVELTLDVSTTGVKNAFLTQAKGTDSVVASGILTARIVEVGTVTMQDVIVSIEITVII